MTHRLKTFIGSTWKLWTLAALCAAALTVAFLLPAPPTQAAACDDFSGDIWGDGSWESTQEAQARTLSGDCAVGYICKEWCTSFCGEVEATGEFNCFPENS